FDGAELDLLASMSRAAQRPLNWNVIRITASDSTDLDMAFEVGAHARANGGRVVALHMPIPSRARFSFKTGFVLDALPGWGEVLSLPLDERVRALADPDVRRKLAEGAAQAKG